MGARGLQARFIPSVCSQPRERATAPGGVMPQRPHQHYTLMQPHPPIHSLSCSLIHQALNLANYVPQSGPSIEAFSRMKKTSNYNLGLFMSLTEHMSFPGLL